MVRRWTYERLLGKEPDARSLAEYETIGKWTLRCLRMAHVTVSDPEFPDKSLVKELELLIWQVNEQWEMLHNPGADFETEKLCDQVFMS